MSASEKRLEHVYAETWARVILKMLMRGIDGQRACEDGLVGGSIRRQCKTVGDFEIIVLPVWDEEPRVSSHGADPSTMPAATNLFGEATAGQETLGAPTHGACTLLDQTIDRMIDDGIFRRGGTWGQRKRTLIPNPYPEISLELYLTDRLNHGNISMIRTGSAEFSKAMASSWQTGGVLPPGLQQAQGYLWRVDDGGRRLELVSCRTERDYFVAAGIPWVNPSERDEGAVKKLRSYVRSTRRAAMEMAA